MITAHSPAMEHAAERHEILAAGVQAVWYRIVPRPMQERIVANRCAPQTCGVIAGVGAGRPVRATAGALLAGALLAGCSSVSDNVFTVFADPGKYQYYSCDQIAGQMKHWSTREQELRALMDKSEQGTGGAVVNVLAYRADYVAATEELKVLETTARGKNCNAPPNWRSNAVVR